MPDNMTPENVSQETNMTPEGEEQEPSMMAGVGPEGAEGLTPELKKQFEGYMNIVMNIIHSEKSRDGVDDMLAAGENPDMFANVPQAANQINTMAKTLMANKGKEVPPDIQIAAAPAIVGDLLELGAADDLWPKPTEDEVQAVLEDSIQMGVEQGLADGSIDPIKLQLDTEGLMDENQQKAGYAFMHEKGMPAEPREEAMIDQIANQRVNKRMGQEAKKQAKQKQQALGGR